MSVRGKQWGRLPEEVQDQILARLPRRDATRLQLVCKSWRHRFSGLLCVDAFRRAEDLYCPVMLSSRCEKNCFGFNLLAKQWRRLPPVHMSGPRSVMSSMINNFHDINVIDCQGSFVCWARPSCMGTGEVFVCNPGGRVTCLPEIVGERGKPLGALFAGLESGGSSDYRVLALILNTDKLPVPNAGPASVYMYDSCQRAWNRLNCDMEAGDTRSAGLRVTLRSSCVMLGHRVFAPAGLCPPCQLLCGTGLSEGLLTFTHLVEYDVELQVWRNTCGLVWRGYKTLVRCARSVVIVTLEPDTREVMIHRLNRGTSQMELVARNSLHAAGFNKRLHFFAKDWNISAAGSKVYIVRLDARRFAQVACYDILNGDSGAWEQLPLSPFPSTKQGGISDFVLLPGGLDLR